MVGFTLKEFGGVIPKIETRLLPNNAGQAAVNVKLFSKGLRPWLRTTSVYTPTQGGRLKSAYRLTVSTSTVWLAWQDDVDVQKSPIAGDTTGKVYWTGDTTTASNSAAGPRKGNFSIVADGGTSYPMDWLEIGVPSPGSAPTIIGTGGTSTVSETRTYIYTYVTQTASWAEEGPPSPVGTGTGKVDATWCISALSTGTTGKYAFSGAIKRIYRTLTDNAGNTNYQLALDNVAISTSSAQDTVADADLGVICPSFVNGVVNSEWVAPPSDLRGLLALPNGIMAGFSGNQICFSEPFFPHAWPIRYRLTTDYDIMAMGVYGQTIIVATKGIPYAVSGSRPDAMAMARIEEMHPCVSKRSLVSFPFGVMWATPDGLALAGPGGAINATEAFMKRDEWQDLCFPDTLIGHQFQNVYFGFFNNGTEDQNFIFDKDNSQGPLTFGSFGAQGVWHDIQTSKLYLIQNAEIREWDADSNNAMPFDWRTKTFVLPRPVNFGAVQVEADYGSLDDAAEVDAQALIDAAANLIILGTGTGGNQEDARVLTAWVGTTSYTTSTGTGAPASIVKSSNGNYMAICVVAGTSSNVEPTWPTTIGGSATDGTVEWKRIHEKDGSTKGSLRGHLLRNHTQYTTADPFIDGTAGNQWGFPIRGSLLNDARAPWHDDRYLLLQVYAISTSTDSTITRVHETSLTNRNAKRLPSGYKSDTWEIRISGNIAVRYFRIAETMDELGKLA